MGTNISLSAKQIKDLLSRRLKNQINTPENKLRPVAIMGHKGIGKTQLVSQVAKEVSTMTDQPVEVISMTLSTLEPPELNGLAYIKDNVTNFARPSFLPAEGAGILFFDEWNRPNVDIQNGLLTLIEDRGINGHKIGDNWLLVFAGNPMGDMEGAELYATQSLDAALEDRVDMVDYRATAEEVVSYLSDIYKTHPLVDFLKNNLDFICLNGKLGTTPRTIEYALRATRDLDPTDEDQAKSMRQELSVVLGLDASMHIMSWFGENYESLTVKEVLTSPKKVASFFEKHGDKNTLVADIARNVVLEITGRLTKEFSYEKQQKNQYVFKKAERKNIAAFIGHLQPEMKLMFFNMIDVDIDQIDFNFMMAFFKHFIDIDSKFNEKPSFLKNIVISEDGIPVFKDGKSHDPTGLFEVLSSSIPREHPNLPELLVEHKVVPKAK